MLRDNVCHYSLSNRILSVNLVQLRNKIIFKVLKTCIYNVLLKIINNLVGNESINISCN